MSTPAPLQSDRYAALALQAINILRVGAAVAATAIVIGVTIIAFTTEAMPTTADPVNEVFDQLKELNAAGFIDLGILLLLLTPFVTVAAIARGFMRMGESRFAGFSIAVLVILGVSIIVAMSR